ncbi:MAG: hypothetical protein QOK12_3742, partial [Mycobacterium sp.]|nr:hypothetical protein [Mycobacterium sp.]
MPLGCTGIRPANAPTLAPSWFVRTHDSVSASPVVDHGSLYVGAWDGMFYAVDVATGKVRWTYQIHTHAQNAFGRIVSTATVLRQRDPSARGGWRRVVIFGGGSAVWALDARTGKRLAVLNLDPRTMAARKAPGASDQTVEVESSPVVGAVKVGGHRQRRIYVGMDVHNDPHVGRT